MRDLIFFGFKVVSLLTTITDHQFVDQDLVWNHHRRSFQVSKQASTESSQLPAVPNHCLQVAGHGAIKEGNVLLDQALKHHLIRRHDSSNCLVHWSHQVPDPLALDNHESYSNQPQLTMNQASLITKLANHSLVNHHRFPLEASKALSSHRW